MVRGLIGSRGRQRARLCAGMSRPQAPLSVMLFDRTLIHRPHQEVRWAHGFSNAVNPTPRSEPQWRLATLLLGSHEDCIQRYWLI